MTERYLSIEEVAKLLDVSERTVTREIKAGKLRAFKVGRSLRFKQEAIEEYIKNQEVDPSELLEDEKEETKV